MMHQFTSTTTKVCSENNNNHRLHHNFFFFFLWFFHSQYIRLGSVDQIIEPTLATNNITYNQFNLFFFNELIPIQIVPPIQASRGNKQHRNLNLTLVETKTIQNKPTLNLPQKVFHFIPVLRSKIKSKLTLEVHSTQTST